MLFTATAITYMPCDTRRIFPSARAAQRNKYVWPATAARLGLGRGLDRIQRVCVRTFRSALRFLGIREGHFRPPPVRRAPAAITIIITNNYFKGLSWTLNTRLALVMAAVSVRTPTLRHVSVPSRDGKFSYVKA